MSRVIDVVRVSRATCDIVIEIERGDMSSFEVRMPHGALCFFNNGFRDPAYVCVYHGKTICVKVVARYGPHTDRMRQDRPGPARGLRRGPGAEEAEP